MGITNLFAQGLEVITPIDLENYLGQYAKAKEVFIEGGGVQYIYDITDLANEENFKYYYERVKKFSALRALKAVGFSIQDIYDEEETNPVKAVELREKFDAMRLRDIFSILGSKYMKLEDHYLGKTNAEYIYAERNLKKLKEDLKDMPEVGFPLQGVYFNTITRGARLGKFYLTSGTQGSGKSRNMIGHCCYLAFPKRFDTESNRWVRTGSNQKVLYISTEMDFDEVQTIILAYLSGVNEDKILWGHYVGDEEARVDEAIKIVSQYRENLIINKIPDPSVNQLTVAIRKHHFFDDVKYVFYDYIFSSPGLLNEYRDLKIREDVALMMLSTALKDLAVELKIFVMSGTQLNAEWEAKKGGIRNQNLLRGAKAIADKIDFGAITMMATKEETDILSRLINELGVETPTQVTDVYKARRSRYKNVRIWSAADLGTGRVKDLFVTDGNFNLINIEQIEVRIEVLDFEHIEQAEKIVEDNTYSLEF